MEFSEMNKLYSKFMEYNKFIYIFITRVSPPTESLISSPGGFPIIAQHVEIFHDNSTKYIIIRNYTCTIITVIHPKKFTLIM